MEQNVLVTGSTGFIGRNLVERLSSTHVLYTPTHAELDLLDEGAVNNYLNGNQIDSIIHCASSGVERRVGQQSGVIEKNLRMFFNLVINSPLYGRLINLGSGAEYDKNLDMRRVKEEDFGRSIPSMEYDFSKFVMGQHVQNSGEDIKHLRLFNVFGKGEDYSQRFISRVICRNLLGLPIEINQNAFFDYFYVNDAVDIINHFVENGSSERIYNIGTGKSIDLLSLAETINEVVDEKSEIIVKKEGLNKEYTGDVSKLMREISDFKFTPLRVAIEELYQYYKEHIGELDRTKIE